MSKIDLDAFMAAWRAVRPAQIPDGTVIKQAEFDLVMAAIRGTWRPDAPAPVAGGDEPAWLVEARSLLGTREIVGPKHNSWIASSWARLGAKWFNDDETPWCGLFVAHCIAKAGHPIPGGGAFARAKAWLNWGKASQPRLGAVVVFGRNGGGHVGFLVGESKANYYVLGGNQSNAVTITPIDKLRALGVRWPASLPLSNVALPAMSGGTISRNEA